MLLKDPSHKKIPNTIFRKDFCGYFWSWNYVFVSLRGKGCIAPKLGQRIKGKKLCRTKKEGSIIREKFAFNVCHAELWKIGLFPVEFWTPHSLPLRVLEQTHWYIVSGAKITIFFLIFYIDSYFVKCYICNQRSFQRSVQPIWLLFEREKIFGRTISLKLPLFALGAGSRSVLVYIEA